ncbi:MAG TPA: formate/nitrite transporter family protein [Beijerinckiaceae bacterium]|nr:formate/nitrite transporter family protein [Beijerinckiaceae bacterium]
MPDPIHPTGLDAYKPAEIAQRIEAAGMGKAGLAFVPLATLSVLAGVFIGFGAAAYTMTMTGADLAFGPARFLGGLVFALGLVLVVIGGAELFTGNTLIVMAWVDRKVATRAMLRNWIIAYFGNLAGSLALVALMAVAGMLSGGMGATAAKIATAKVNLGFVEAFTRGILCNALVCLAVWLTFAGHSATDKILAILLPIAAFVLLGFEHCIANMYLIPAGWLAGAPVTAGGFANNLLAVTLGNIVGGAGGVALSYWLAYGRRE